MKNILVIGAGRSATALIDYLLEACRQHGWFLTVGDVDAELAMSKVNGHSHGRGTWLDVAKPNDRREMLERADLVITSLPAHLHLEVAHDCIRLNKVLLTSSYVTKELYRLGDEARDRELMFTGEMGLDPGMEHLSAVAKIEELQSQGIRLQAFRSYAGGLLTPDHRANPWQYKFTWSPRNIVLEGQGTAQYLENGRHRFIPYHRLFKDFRRVEIEGLGDYEVYANRDALIYRDVYGLKEVDTIFKGTLRPLGFCDAWNALIQLGFTDGSFPILESEKMTYNSLTESFLGGYGGKGGSVRDRTADFLGEAPDSPVMEKLDWLGLFRKNRVNFSRATPALMLQNLLEKKWTLNEKDQDMVIIQHEFEYRSEQKNRCLKSTLIVRGEDQHKTAMTKVVGLPVAVFAKLVMQGKVKDRGVQVPVQKIYYEPVLEELKDFGLSFQEREFELD